MKTIPKFECAKPTAPVPVPVNDSIESADERLDQAIKEHRSALIVLGENLGQNLTLR